MTREFILRDGFVRKYIEGDLLPFSFNYGGRKAKVSIVTKSKVRTDANQTNYFILGRTGPLEVRMSATVYQSHAAVDWSTEITNTSSKNSLKVSKGLGMSLEFEGSNVKMWHSTGDYVSADGLDQMIDPLCGSGIRLESNGRPCDGAFPYFRLFFKDYTIDCAVGWQAKWAGTFKEKDGKVRVNCGQAILDSYMKPGETFKLSSSTLLFVDGGNEQAINDWRKYYFDCILPKPNGKMLEPLFTGTGADSSLEFCFSRENTQIDYYNQYIKEGLKPDIWWIDAGWYDYDIGDGHKDWVRTGTWEIDKNRFPNGFTPISDLLHKNGTKFLLWFEPERVHIRTKLYTEHKDWLLESPKDIYCALLNYGNPEALEYISNHLNKMIKENGIDVYRQDFNCDPDNYFRDTETKDRQGANENLHCRGYLKLWDNILEANPGLWIDACASGGRRNDIETMKRSVPLHYSDFGYGDLPIKDSFQHTMFEWLPYFKEQALTWSDENSAFVHLGALSAFSSIGFDFRNQYKDLKYADAEGNPSVYDFSNRNEEEVAIVHKYFDIWKIFKKYVYGNYYSHTPYGKKDDKWSIMQFACPECGNGIIKALRFKNNEQPFYAINVREIDEDAKYILTELVSGDKSVVTGRMLSRNFSITLDKGDAVIYEYKKLK